jgi:hypothetical protein
MPVPLTTMFRRRRAVLISGGLSAYQNYARYLNDLKAFYACLTSNLYQFAHGDIQVVYANGGIHDMGGHSVTTVAATKANVRHALHQAVVGGGSSLGQDELLVICTTNHGTAIPNRLTLWTPQEYLTPAELGQELVQSQDYSCVCIFGHCFGTSMFHQVKLNTTHSVLVAASSSASYALPPDEAYDSFLYHFTAALLMNTPSDYPAASDQNKDGHISVQEAFDFAKGKNKTADKPQLDESSPGLAARTTLWGVL